MVDAGQSFLGGLRLKQQRRQDAFNNEQIMVQQNQSIADSLIAAASEIQKNAAAVGKEADLSIFRDRLEGLVLGAGALRARQFNTDPDTILQSIDTNLARFDAITAAAGSVPTPQETATVEGEAAAAGVVATAEALTEAGTPTTTSQTAQAAGLVPTPATDQPAASDIVTFRMPDGSLRPANINETEKVKGIIDQGGVKISLSVQSPGLEGIGALSGATPKEIEKVKGNIQDLNADIEEMSGSLKQFEETPEAGGILGVLIEKIGGIAQQLPGGQVALDFAGVDPAQVKKVRSNALAVVSRMLKTITAEDNSRFTDNERKVAQEVLGTLEPTSSTEQISAALNGALDMLKRAEGRELVRFLQGFDGDISTPDGQEAFVGVLIANGFTQERAINAMLDLQERLGL